MLGKDWADLCIEDLPLRLRNGSYVTNPFNSKLWTACGKRDIVGR